MFANCNADTTFAIRSATCRLLSYLIQQSSLILVAALVEIVHGDPLNLLCPLIGQECKYSFK